MARNKSELNNRQILTRMVKELSDIEIAFIRERLILVCKTTLNNRENIIESMKDGFVSPTLYLNSIEKALKIIDFE